MRRTVLGVSLTALMLNCAYFLHLIFAQEKGKFQPPADAVCGPRVLYYVLQQYGVLGDLTLIDFVREVQWPNVRRGTSMADLADALERRGIFSEGVEIPPNSQLRWHEFAILHFSKRRKSSGNGQGDGHFAVLLPSSTTQEAHIWNGLAGEQVGLYEELAEQLSGYVVLTSRRPINLEHVSISSHERRSRKNEYRDMRRTNDLSVVATRPFGTKDTFRSTLCVNLALLP